MNIYYHFHANAEASVHHVMPNAPLHLSLS